MKRCRAAAVGVIAFVLAAAAPASAFTRGALTVNGVPALMSPFKVRITLSASGGITRIFVGNPASTPAGNVVTGINGVTSQSAGSASVLRSVYYRWSTFDPKTGYKVAKINCNLSGPPHAPDAFQCRNPGIRPGMSVSYAVIGAAGQLITNFQSINIQVDNGKLGACLRAAIDGHAAANCTPPSHTRITTSKIEGVHAFFRFIARHATGYRCELFHGNRIMFNTTCNRGHKSYASRLPRGRYAFVVTGTNAAGYDPHPATKTFRIR